jgi:putative tryptophan/tyrosine transport system substrate-binding protein
MATRTFRKRTRDAAVAAVVVLTPLVLGACSGSDDSSAEEVPRVGLMHVGTDHIPPSWPSLKGRLEELGWRDGQNIKLMWRNLEPEAAEAQAEVFVGQGADVIVAFEDTSIGAAQEATAASSAPIPIVFLHPSDPVRDGLVETLNRPDRNLTGVYGARDEVDKQLEIYQLLVPQLRRMLTLVDPQDPRTERLLLGYRAAASQLPRPIELDIREASDAKELMRIFRSLRPGEVDGAFLLSPSLRLNHSALTIRLAKRARLPVQAHRKEWVEQGALFSYGIDLPLIGRAGARYVDSLLQGMSPAELPVEEVSKIELAINLDTAARLGIKVPQDMIIRADEVYRGGT